MIHFTNDGIYADSEEERLEFYDRMHTGDPVIMAHLQLYRNELKLLNMKGGEYGLSLAVSVLGQSRF